MHGGDYMATVIGIGNRVGGVGKSTTAIALAYILDQRGKKVLLIDSDAQGDSGFLLELTYKNFVQANAQGTLYSAYMSGNLADSITKVSDNIDTVIVGDEIENLDVQAAQLPLGERTGMLKAMLDKVKDKYDFVFIDLPPAASSVTSTNGIFASDYLLVPAQTAAKDVRNTFSYISIIQRLRKDYGIKTDLAGVLPYFFKGRDGDDIKNLRKLRKTLGSSVFEHEIYRRKRVSKFFENGVTDNKKNRWDVDWKDQFNGALDELIARIKILEGDK